MWLRIILAVLLACMAGGFAHASDSYSDNRSSAVDLVRSLYNAVNHHEYARAYDYFASPPAKDFAAFQAGYDHTTRVDVITGAVTGDGAAGSTYFTVPTAIKATDDKGGSKVFVGCYTVRAVNGAVQEPPFRPLQIYKGELKPAKTDDFAVYNLPTCGEVANVEAPQKATVEDATARFVVEQQGHCDKVEETRGGANEPHAYKIRFAQAGAAADEPLSEVSLFVFDCTMAAYNETQVFYLGDTSGSGLTLLSFAEPHLEIKYLDADSAKLKSMTVDGFSATTELVNSEFDAKTNTITSFNKWRGIGDASSSGTYAFVDGQFVLKDYAADPTFDEQQNPVSIVKNGKLL